MTQQHPRGLHVPRHEILEYGAATLSEVELPAAVFWRGAQARRFASATSHCLHAVAVAGSYRPTDVFTNSFRAAEMLVGQTILAKVSYPTYCLVNIIIRHFQGAGTQRNDSFASIGRVSFVGYPAVALKICYDPTDRG